MRILGHLITIIVLATPFAGAHAQALHEEEHRYQFTLQGTVDPATEKQLLAAIADMEPRMHINIDHAEQMMKVLAYRTLYPEAIIDIALQYGVVLVDQRSDPAPIGVNEEQ